MSVISELRQFIDDNCPFLNSKKQINVNFLSEKAVEYTIEQVPADIFIEKYIDGSTMRQILFVFASREYYGEEVIGNLKASEFFEKFQYWMEQTTQAGILPVLDDCMTSEKLEALTCGYAYDTNIDNARYQIQCRFVYYQEN